MPNAMGGVVPYLDLFLECQVPHFLPWYLLAAQVKWESNFDAVAVSSAGAWGLAQFMPGTWASWGQGDPTEPRDCIRAQAKFMSWCMSYMAEMEKPGWKWAIAAYTWGPARTAKCAGWGQVPEVVRKHVDRVLRTAEEYRGKLGVEGV